MRNTRWSRVAAVSVAGFLALGVAACGEEETDDVATTEAADEVTDESTDETTEATAESIDAPFGPACSAVPSEGAGSFDGMSSAPVATAASNNPVLSTLVTAVQQAGLVDTLNSANDITVFAPSNEAFAEIPEEQLNALLADKEQLTKVLTYHVVGQRLAPEEIGEGGPYATLAEEQVEVSGEAPELTVGEDANVVCGGVQTANATVYIIDSVLMPESMSMS